MGSVGSNMQGVPPPMSELESGPPKWVPEGITNLGPGLRVLKEGQEEEGGVLGQEEFLDVLRRSSVLVGVGRPFS